MKLIVTGAHHLGDTITGLPGGSPDWCYFGTNPETREKTLAVFGENRRTELSEAMVQTAFERREDFLRWMSDIGEGQEKISWWCSHAASMNPLQTDLFQLACFASLFRKWALAEEKDGGTRMVVVEDPWLHALLERNFSAIPNVSFENGSRRGRLAETVLRACKGLAVRLYVFLRFSWTLAASRLLCGRLSAADMEASSPNVLIHTWIENKTFPTKDKIKDPYTGRLDEIAQASGISVFRLTPLKFPLRFLKLLRRHRSRVAVLPAYLAFWDIFRTVLSGFRIRNLAELSRYDEMDAGDLLRREIAVERAGPAFQQYLLSFFAMQRLTRRLRERVRAVVYPCENQPWEKVLCASWHRSSPSTRLIAYQHTSFGPLALNFFRRGSWSDESAPHILATNGQRSLDLLAASGYPRERLVNGGALRYEYLHDLVKQPAPQHRRNDSPRVLTAFSIHESAARQLLRALISRFRSPDVEFLLKCHPDVPIGRLMNGNETLPPWIKVSERPFQELLKEADAFLFTPPTTTSWEAFLAGLDTLKFVDDSLDLDAEDPGTAQPLPSCNAGNLAEAVASVLIPGPSRIPAHRRREILVEVFSPVHEDTWRRLLS